MRVRVRVRVRVRARVGARVRIRARARARVRVRVRFLEMSSCMLPCDATCCGQSWLKKMSTGCRSCSSRSTW